LDDICHVQHDATSLGTLGITASQMSTYYLGKVA